MTDVRGFPKIEDKEALEEGDILAPAFDAQGLIAAIVTSSETGEVLMFAYMNEEALSLTIKTGEAYFWSRSRKSLWHKGATSGNTLRITEIRIDCDQDVLWLSANMEGAGACCHTGRVSCFYRSVPFGADAGQKLQMVHEDRRFDPADVYGNAKPESKV